MNTQEASALVVGQRVAWMDDGVIEDRGRVVDAHRFDTDDVRGFVSIVWDSMDDEPRTLALEHCAPLALIAS